MVGERQPAGLRACVFDAYGTLFDVHAAVGRHRAELGDQADAVSALWREKQLDYSWLRTLMGRHVDFWQVTGDALDHALARHGIANPALRARLMAAYRTLAAYPEVPGVLARLRAAGFKLAILSNGAPAMLADALASAGLAALLDAVYSVEAVGRYKPDPAVYQLAVAGLGVAAGEIAFLSANCWDAHGAAAFGCRAIWINRSGLPDDGLPGALSHELPDLAGLPALLGA